MELPEIKTVEHPVKALDIFDMLRIVFETKPLKIMHSCATKNGKFISGLSIMRKDGMFGAVVAKEVGTNAVQFFDRNWDQIGYTSWRDLVTEDYENMAEGKPNLEFTDHDTMILTGRYLEENSESPERDMIRDVEDINGKD